MLVKSYDEYLKLLDAEIVKNGKNALSDAQIYNFIKDYQLGSSWRITSEDVKADMQPIIKRYEQSRKYLKMKAEEARQRREAEKDKISTYDDYLNALKKEISNNNGEKLNHSQILDFISEHHLGDFGITEHDIAIDMDTIPGAIVGGVVFGNVSNASTIYGSDKFATPRGHGFAAERANHLYDKIENADFFGQNKVQLVGEDIDPATGRIVKNGADRVVNGTNIQTKYCKTGGKCISECFEDGRFRYINPDGTPMQIEVPSDKYESAIQAMENRIKNGEIPGVTDPADANKIVRRGHFSYEQAKNIAKAGNVDSLRYDATNGTIVATCSFGISTVLSFATSVWNGEDFDAAIKNATYTGLKVGGTTFITAVLASQLSKAGLNSALVGSSEAIVGIMGPKASAMLVNAFRNGTNIYGAAAMKSAAKMLRGNAITGAVSVVVLSSVDIVNIFRGRISGKQLFKNVANTATTVAGGTAGWVGGATAGATIGSVIPVIGTAAGGIIGGIVGSFAAGAASSKVSNAVLGAFIEDDAEEMVRIIEEVFQELAVDYLLNQKEAEKIVEALKNDLSGGTLKNMFASADRKKYARNLLVGHFEREVKKRKRISMPSDDEMMKSLKAVLEDIADSSEFQSVLT